MQQPLNEPKTFSEMVLVLLEDRFPWLGNHQRAPAADTVVRLNELHRDLKRVTTMRIAATSPRSKIAS